MTIVGARKPRHSACKRRGKPRSLPVPNLSLNKLVIVQPDRLKEMYVPHACALREADCVIAGQRCVDGNVLGRPKDEQTFIRRGTPTLLPTDPLESDDGRTPQEYLEQAGARKNLHVLVSSPVTRVLFKGKNATGDLVASGVEFGEQYTARAKREVILCAG